MSSHNLANVYSGPDAVKNYFNPECHPPLPLVEIPECLNPFRQDGVRIYAKMMSMHPATNVKVIPAMNLLEKGVKPGKTKTIVESSSGSTVISMAMVARAFHGIDDVHAYLSNKTSETKIKLMQFFGLKVSLFGGPSQPTPVDERGGICAASQKARESESVCSPNQYINDDNWKAHVRWTGPQIHKQLPQINVIAASMGTSGTMTGLGTYFKEAKPSVHRLAVCTNSGDKVPGPREYSLMAEVKFPYKHAVDSLEEVNSPDSFNLSLDLTRQGLVCGPSSGFTLQGLLQMLERRKREGSLDKLRGQDGEINCVFMCCDLPYQYLNEYFDKCSPEKFAPIHNEQLRKLDLYPYHEDWEVSPESALSSFFTCNTMLPVASSLISLAASHPQDLEEALTPRPKTQVIDFRSARDYEAFHLPGSINIPLASVPSSSAASPFSNPIDDTSVLESLWSELDNMFPAAATDKSASSSSNNPTAAALVGLLKSRKVLTVCYDGDVGRVANSVLRKRGIKSECVRGGMGRLAVLELPGRGEGASAGVEVSVRA